MTKKHLCAFIIFAALLIGCAKKAPISGFVGKPLELTPTLKAPEDSVNCLFKWSFVTKPPESNMDVLSFQPDSRSFTVSFVPDVVGEYEVEFSMTTTDGKEKLKQSFRCSVIEDTSRTAQETAPPPVTVPAPLPQYSRPAPTATAPAPVYQAPKPAKPKSAIRGREIPKVADKYTIQISSWKSYAKAEDAQRKLAALAIDAYIQKAYFSETKETWYRVRTGNFESYEQARAAMQSLKQKFPEEKFWIDFVREDQQ